MSNDGDGAAQLRSECDHLRSTNRQLQMEIEQLTMINTAHANELDEQANEQAAPPTSCV